MGNWRTSAAIFLCLWLASRAWADITGALPDPGTICQRLGPMQVWESRLQAELRAPGGPEEIFALLDQYGQLIVRRRGSTARLSWVRRYELSYGREVAAAELAGLRAFLQRERVHDLRPFAILDCNSDAAWEFLHLSRTSGRRLFVIAPLYHDVPQVRLVKHLLGMARADLRVTYDAVTANPGVKLLHAVPGNEPERDPRVVIDETCMSSDHRPVWARAGRIQIRAGSHAGRCGLWRVTAGGTPELIRDGEYANPVIAPDGAWVVAVKFDQRRRDPHGMVRVDLKTKREYGVPIPPSDSLESLAYVAPRKAVLVRREKAFALVDPRTGFVSPIAGELAPLAETSRRALQPTDRPDEVWAALRRGKDTEVGRYDLNALRFDPVKRLKGFEFESQDMWVDEPANRIEFVTEKKLFAAPLR